VEIGFPNFHHGVVSNVRKTAIAKYPVVPIQASSHGSTLQTHHLVGFPVLYNGEPAKNRFSFNACLDGQRCFVFRLHILLTILERNDVPLRIMEGTKVSTVLAALYRYRTR
jgi:hypothetical protein